eukprot:scaffold150581_cov31-Tisochrysis_lutea.AAC.1
MPLENWDHELHPLRRAVASNNVGVVRLLLAAGVSPNLQDRADGQTALMSACRRVHPHLVQVLLKAGARLEVRDKEGRTARDHAASGWGVGQFEG